MFFYLFFFFVKSAPTCDEGFSLIDDVCVQCVRPNTYQKICGQKFNPHCYYKDGKCLGFDLTIAKTYDSCTQMSVQYGFDFSKTLCVDCSLFDGTTCGQKQFCFWNKTLCQGKQAKSVQNYSECIALGDAFAFDMFSTPKCRSCDAYSEKESECVQFDFCKFESKKCLGRRQTDYNKSIICNQLGNNFQLGLRMIDKQCINCNSFNDNEASCSSQVDCSYRDKLCMPVQQCYGMCEQILDQRTCEGYTIDTINNPWSRYKTNYNTATQFICGWKNQNCMKKDCTFSTTNVTSINYYQCQCDTFKCWNQLCEELSIDSCNVIMNDMFCQWENNRCAEYDIESLRCDQIYVQSICEKNISGLTCLWDNNKCIQSQCEYLFDDINQCYNGSQLQSVQPGSVCLWNKDICGTISNVQCSQLNQSQCVYQLVKPDMNCIWQKNKCRVQNCNDLNQTSCTYSNGFKSINGEICDYDQARNQCVVFSIKTRCMDLLNQQSCSQSDQIIRQPCYWVQEFGRCEDLQCSLLTKSECVNSQKVITISNKTQFCDFDWKCMGLTSYEVGCNQIKSEVLCNNPEIYKFIKDYYQCRWVQGKCENLLCSKLDLSECQTPFELKDGICIASKGSCKFQNRENRCSFFDKQQDCMKDDCEWIRNKCLLKNCANYGGNESQAVSCVDKGKVKKFSLGQRFGYQRYFCDNNRTENSEMCYNLPYNQSCTSIISMDVCNSPDIRLYTNMRCIVKDKKCINMVCSDLTTKQQCLSESKLGFESLSQDPQTTPQFLCRWNQQNKCDTYDLQQPIYCEDIEDQSICNNITLQSYKCEWITVIKDRQINLIKGNIQTPVKYNDKETKSFCISKRCEYYDNSCECMKTPGCYFAYPSSPYQIGQCMKITNCEQIWTADVCSQTSRCQWNLQISECLTIPCESNLIKSQCDQLTDCHWDWSTFTCRTNSNYKPSLQTCEDINKLALKDVKKKQRCIASKFSNFTCSWVKLEKICQTNVNLPCEMIKSQYLCSINRYQDCQWNQGYCTQPLAETFEQQDNTPIANTTDTTSKSIMIIVPIIIILLY